MSAANALYLPARSRRTDSCRTLGEEATNASRGEKSNLIKPEECSGEVMGLRSDFLPERRPKDELDNLISRRRIQYLIEYSRRNFRNKKCRALDI